MHLKTKHFFFILTDKHTDKNLRDHIQCNKKLAFTPVRLENIMLKRVK